MVVAVLVLVSGEALAVELDGDDLHKRSQQIVTHLTTGGLSTRYFECLYDRKELGDVGRPTPTLYFDEEGLLGGLPRNGHRRFAGLVGNVLVVRETMDEVTGDEHMEDYPLEEFARHA